MAEPLPAPPTPETAHAPVDEAAIAHKNMVWGWALFGLFWLLFGGTVAVAYLWLWLS